MKYVLFKTLLSFRLIIKKDWKMIWEVYKKNCTWKCQILIKTYLFINLKNIIFFFSLKKQQRRIMNKYFIKEQNKLFCFFLIEKLITRKNIQRKSIEFVSDKNLWINAQKSIEFVSDKNLWINARKSIESVSYKNR